MENKKIIIRCRGIIVDEGELMVMRHVNSNFFALPGGGMELGEDVNGCVSRELIEELGVKPEIGRLLYLNNYTHSDGERHSVEFIFEILNSKDYRNIENLTKTHGHEVEELRWVKQSDDLLIYPKAIGEDFKKGTIFSDEVRYTN